MKILKYIFFIPITFALVLVLFTLIHFIVFKIFNLNIHPIFFIFLLALVVGILEKLTNLIAGFFIVLIKKISPTLNFSSKSVLFIFIINFINGMYYLYFMPNTFSLFFKITMAIIYILYSFNLLYVIQIALNDKHTIEDQNKKQT